ncbi:hypothetical protein [Fischerella thermalis]|uniref:hypothetical protein n=1 Tax=Fischerella thermalis TaxID=372787 RepID=UPI0011AEFABD|nr:hypothetical protein [Fischerella thermalis]
MAPSHGAPLVFSKISAVGCGTLVIRAYISPHYRLVFAAPPMVRGLSRMARRQRLAIPVLLARVGTRVVGGGMAARTTVRSDGGARTGVAA